MEIRYLKLVKAVVESGSLAKAIEELHLTQSALSHQSKELEYFLGTHIFLRQNKKMILTSTGQALYEAAKGILDKMNLTEALIKSIVYGETGEIRISAECFSGYHWLARVLKQFHR
jgi:LysR family transcriptional regulator, regulator for metE and metH